MSFASFITGTITILTWSQTDPFRAWCAQPLGSRLGQCRSHLRLMWRGTEARLVADTENYLLKTLGF